MKWLNGYRIRLALAGFVAAMVLSGGSAKADFTFGKAQSLGPRLNTTSGDATQCTSADSLSLYFASNRTGGLGGWDLYVSTRQSLNDSWGSPVNLGSAVNRTNDELYPSLPSDGLTLYFSDLYSGTPRPGGLGGADLWMTTRTSRGDPWTTPVNVGVPINSAANELDPTVSGDGLILVFGSNRSGGSGGYDLWMSTRAAVQDPWGPPVNLGPNVNVSSQDLECGVSADGLALFFCSNRSGGVGSFDLWMTTRKNRNNPWGQAVNLGTVINSAADDGAPGVSSDMRTLYFNSSREGGLGSYDLYEVPIIPIVDFNGDGKVGLEDLVRLIESWGKDDPSVDIGPGPWGDGVVDKADLEVLISYWGQEVPNLNLVAHWKLDETEGGIAADSAGNNDGTLSGGPLWQPEGGQVGGALQFDGVDDCLITPFIVNPADGPFSVLAWVKGGIPGQVIVSQIGGADWLCADPSGGRLMTGLLPPPSRTVPPPLVSELVITDGNWHRIGFVWDSSHRRLCVDGVVAAEDTQTSLAGSANGLYIGCGKAMGAGTFWSGLIDDVRIYNRAVSP